jgi:DDE superfamily endonuclease
MCLVFMHTNNQMWKHGYQRKTGKQFLDFIKRVDQQKYGSSIKQIFVILDNIWIHKSNKVKQTISKHYLRIHLLYSSSNPIHLNSI